MIDFREKTDELRARANGRGGGPSPPPPDGGNRRPSGNNLPEGPWCGHPFIDLRTRLCSNDDCRRALPPGAWERLQNARQTAPPGAVWVLESGYQDEEYGSPWGPTPANPGGIVGLFSDRRKILHRLVRGYVTDAKDIRQRHVHWYQGAFNEECWVGWDEGDVERPESYSLSLWYIDSV